MRVLAVGKTDVLPYIKEVVDRLNWFLKRVCENPSNPIFSHYLFECISITTKLVANNPNALPGVENPFFESFAVVIEKDVAEFAPYVFQCLALTLELREPRFSLPMTHRLLPEFVKPQWWLRSGNIPALVRLLQAYLRQAPIENFTPELISGILGVWQKLISSTATDHEGFYLLEAVVQYLPKEVFQANVSMLFQIIFMRIHKAKNEKFTRSFVVFLSLFMGKHGAAFVVDIVDAIQNG
jgi:exportin-2 (importin alpha re-exporter)